MRFVLLFLALMEIANAQVPDKIRIGMVTTLSGPGADVGRDIRDGFKLALRHLDGAMAGIPVELLLADDRQSLPETRKAVRTFIRRDRVHFLTGIVYSNIMLDAGPEIFRSHTYYISANAGPSQYAGAGCSRYFFNVASLNDSTHEAAGKHMARSGYRNVVLVVPRYPAGDDAVRGFLRSYRGEPVHPIYVALEQSDFTATIRQIQSHAPDAVYIFLPGQLGSRFIPQLVGSGLLRSAQMFAPGFSADEDIIGTVGAPMLGVLNASPWAHDLKNPENLRFVAAFSHDFGRLPTLYAAQGYDAAMLMNSGVAAVHGDFTQATALQHALEQAQFKSVRGNFKFNRNHYPIQNYYLRMVGRNTQGQMTNKLLGEILHDQDDAYASLCHLH
jgi:branched-chain amino acid transport system substrate-binding protein